MEAETGDALQSLYDQRERLLAERAENKRELDNVTARINDLETIAEIAKRISNFTPDEKQALFQELRAGGITSGETFGTI